MLCIKLFDILVFILHIHFNLMSLKYSYYSVCLITILHKKLSIFALSQGKDAASPSEKSNANQEKKGTESKQSPGNKRPIKEEKSKADRGRKKAKRTGEEREAEDKEEEKCTTLAGQRPKNSKRRSIASKVSYKEESSSGADEKLVSDDDFQAPSEEECSVDSESKEKSTKRTAGKRKSKSDWTKINTAQKQQRSGGKLKQDSRELEEKKEMEEGGGEGGTRTMRSGAKRRSGQKKGRPGDDEWLEVYLAKTSSWICVDVEHGIGKPHLCSQNATSPVTYVVSVDGDGFVKDLGRKYDPTWMTLSRKRRVDEEWWEETLTPFMGPEDEKDKKEEKEVP